MLLEEKKNEASKALFLSNTQHKVLLFGTTTAKLQDSHQAGERTLPKQGMDSNFLIRLNLKFCKFITIFSFQMLIWFLHFSLGDLVVEKGWLISLHSWVICICLLSSNYFHSPLYPGDPRDTQTHRCSSWSHITV